MKNKIILSVMTLGLITWSCSESPIGQQPIDSIAPGAVSNVNVKNIPGGAILSYTLPDDEDLLYVKAVYNLKEGLAEAKSTGSYELFNMDCGIYQHSPRAIC